VLFELLVVGVIRDIGSCRVYHRRKRDAFLVEVPNSIGDKTAAALRFTAFMPTETVVCDGASLATEKPKFVNQACTMLKMHKEMAMGYVGKYLRAFKANVLQYRTEHYKLDYDPFQDSVEMGPIEIFEILLEYCELKGPPSWNNVCAFVHFMWPMMQMTVRWPIMQWQLEDLAPIWQNNFKHSFVHLLIATSKDFSTRSVPPGDQTRQVDGAADDDGGGLLRTTSSGGTAARLATTGSKQVRDETLEQTESDEHLRALQNPAEAANRFESMISWENSDHPVAVWLMAPDGVSVDGVNILSLNARFVDAFINRNLKATLGPGGICHPPIEFNRDWSKLKNAEGVEILRHAMGWEGQVADRLNPRYVLTVDNLLKMLSISLRVKFGMPVIVMGETGCGKSSLMTAMCAVLGFRLHTLNIHGGMTDADVIEWMDAVIDEIEAADVAVTGRMTHVAFLDEVNTCNSMGLFKEMLCDGYMNGRRIPDTVKVVAACNPYRLRKKAAGDEAAAGLVFQHGAAQDGQAENVGTGIKDPLGDLVYRVHPLPESMTDYIFDFGALSQDTEEMYIKAMIRNNLSLYVTEEEMAEEMGSDEQLDEIARSMGLDPAAVSREELTAMMQARAQEEAARRAAAGEDVGAETNQWGHEKANTKFGEFVETFTALVCSAQEFVREFHGGERSSASLRDVARCIQVYRFFGEHFAKTQTTYSMEDFFLAKPAARRHIRSAMFMSLAFCYHSRLPRSERLLLRMRISDTWRDMQVPPTRTQYGWRMPGRDYCAWLQLTPTSFEEVLEEVQKSFTSQMRFPAGIALNEALCENVFMLLCSILNQIPIFIIGEYLVPQISTNLYRKTGT
jgi:energy-coupling factor transporter ATP-binding protein EcfA2